MEFPLLAPVGSVIAACSRAETGFVAGACFAADPDFEVAPGCGAGTDYVADERHDHLAAARQPRWPVDTIKSGFQRLWPRAL